MPLTAAQLVQQLEEVQRDAAQLLDGLDTRSANWQPAPHRWSVLQCLNHLARTVELYAPRMEALVPAARARAAAGERPYREGWIARKFVAGMEPPPRLRVRAPRSIAPASDLELEQVRRAFHAAHDRLVRIAADAGDALGHGRMKSPFVGLLSLTLGQAVAANAAHARRHLWQAWQVRRDPAFPSGSSGPEA